MISACQRAVGAAVVDSCSVVDKSQDHTTAAGDSVDLDGWRAELQVLFATRVGPLFARREPRAAAKAMLVGLLWGLERKNGWWLAEHAGHARPDTMQRLLRTARWDDRELIGRFAATWSSSSARLMACWCATRPDSPRRAPARQALLASTRAPWGEWTTARSRCSSATPAAGGMR